MDPSRASSRNRQTIAIGILVAAIVLGLSVWLGLRGDESTETNERTATENVAPVDISSIRNFEDCILTPGHQIHQGPPRGCQIGDSEVFPEGAPY